MGAAKKRGTLDQRIAQAIAQRESQAEDAMSRMVANLNVVNQRRNLNTMVVRHLLKETYPGFIFPEAVSDEPAQ